MKRISRQRGQGRRKRVIMLVLIALVLTCSPLFARSVSRQSSAAPVARVVAPSQAVVQPGDALWGIARKCGPAREEVRSIVYRIKQVDRLDASVIHPGDVLIIPQDSR